MFLDGVPACTVHGTFDHPLRPRETVRARLRAVTFFRDSFSGITVGAGRIAEDLCQGTMVLQLTPGRASVPATTSPPATGKEDGS